MAKDSVVIFTHSFPFGNEEQFLYEEVQVLSKKFKRVFIVPSKKADELLELPANVEVITKLFGINRRSLVEIFLRNIWRVISIYSWTLFRKNHFKLYSRFFKSFLHYLLVDINKYSTVFDLVMEHKLQDAIFYDYWFVNSTISLSLLRKKGIVANCICRAHGFDLYDERNFETVVSFRDFKVENLDYIYAVSKHGLDYLKSKVDEKYHYKLGYSYLGIEKVYPKHLVAAQVREPTFLVVSCSRVIPLKRIELIPKVLDKLNLPVHWVHFGDGPMFNLVKKNAQNMSASTFKQYGTVPNSMVHEFYAKHDVGLFISLSESEGIPVSMMEAIAYGIPVFSTDVGGVKEIVSSSVGVTIPIETPTNQISDMLADMISEISRYNRSQIIDIFRSKFSAAENYQSFYYLITK